MQPHIVDRKYRLARMVTKVHSELGRNVGIMLRMCKALFSTSKDVVVYSFFFNEWYCCTCGQGSACRPSYQEALLLAEKCSRGPHQLTFLYKEVVGVGMLEVAI